MEGSTPTMEPFAHDTYAQFFADLKSAFRRRSYVLRLRLTANLSSFTGRSAATSLIGSKRRVGELKSSIALRQI